LVEMSRVGELSMNNKEQSVSGCHA
jgi:hypothetical protein